MENVRFFHLLNKTQPADVNIYLHLQTLFCGGLRTDCNYWL